MIALGLLGRGRILDDLGQTGDRPDQAASGPPARPDGDVRRPARVPRRLPCAGSRRSGHGRTGRSRPGSRSTASWPARCRSRCRSSRPREAKNQRAASTPTSASSSSRVMNVAGPLAHRDLDAVADEPDPGHEEHPDGVLVEAHRLRRVADPGDRPVVVGAPDVDQLVEAATELLHDVADVGGEVGRLAVRPDDRPGPCRRRTRSIGTTARRPARTRGRRPEAARSPARPSRRVERAPRWSRRRSGRRGARATPRCPARTRSDAQRPTIRGSIGARPSRPLPRLVGDVRRELDHVVAVVAVLGDRSPRRIARGPTRRDC